MFLFVSYDVKSWWLSFQSGVSYGGSSVAIGVVCIGGLINWKTIAARTAAAKSASR